MAINVRDRAIDDARSVSAAAQILVRALDGGQDDLDSAIDRLELRAKLADGGAIQAFDATADHVTDEDSLAAASTQLAIGITLLAAESAVAEGHTGPSLTSASETLAGTADYLESQMAKTEVIHSFELSPGGVTRSLHSAATAALDEMSEAAASVNVALFTKALKPVVKRLPDQIVAEWNKLDVPGRLARWGLRALRRGMDLLLRLVDLEAIRAAQSRIDEVLLRLGQGDDNTVIAGWAIGADAVREGLGDRAKDAVEPARITELARLADRFGKLCGLLSRAAAIIAGIPVALGVVHVALPHAIAVTTVGLAMVLTIVITYGRDYTGASEWPGGVRGVRLVVGDIDARR